MPNHPPLYRDEFLAANRETLGRVIPWRPSNRRVLAAALCALVAASAWFLATTEFAEKVNVQGLVTPVIKPAVVRSRVAGYVAALQVAPDDTIAAGAVVARIDTSEFDARGRSLSEDHVVRLREQRARLAKERDIYTTLAARKEAVLVARKARLGEALASQDERVRLAELSASTQAVRRDRVHTLAAEAWVSQDDVARVDAAWLASRERLAALARERLEDRSHRAEAALGLQELRAQAALDQARLDARLAELDLALASALAGGQKLVLAPVSGRIADLVAHVGLEVAPGDALLSIQPLADEHVIEAYLPSTAAGRVREGMRARVRYSGYPQNDFGAASGVVERIGSVGRELGGQIVYLCRIRIVERSLGIDHTPAGMQVDVDVLLDVRSLKDRLLAPIVEMVGRF